MLNKPENAKINTEKAEAVAAGIKYCIIAFASDRKKVRLKTDIPVFFMRYSSAQPAI